MSVLYNDVQKGQINKQPRIQKFWNFSCYYEDIYDWISPFNKPSGSWFILTLQSIGEMSMVFPVTCLFSLFWVLKHLMMLLKYNFFRASFLHLIKDSDNMEGHTAQIF